MEELKTLGNVSADKWLPFTFTSSQVTQHLRDQILGVKGGVSADYTRWTGISENESYVRMRVMLDPRVICRSTKPETDGERIIQEVFGDPSIREDADEALKPFTYPMINTNDIQNLQRLYKQGLAGQRLQEVMAFRKLVPLSNNMYGIYLRPETIIGHILSDPVSGKTPLWKIVSVGGMTSDTIVWRCIVANGEESAQVIGSTDEFNKLFRT